MNDINENDKNMDTISVTSEDKLEKDEYIDDDESFETGKSLDGDDMSDGDYSEYSDNSSKMSTNDNDVDNDDSREETLYEKTQNNEIDFEALEKFAAIANNKEFKKSSKKSSKNKTKQTSSLRYSSSRAKSSRNRNKLLLRKNSNVKNLKCVHESSMSFANQYKKNKAVLHANKYLAQAGKDEFPFKTVDEITFEQIDSNCGNIVGE